MVITPEGKIIDGLDYSKLEATINEMCLQNFLLFRKNGCGDTTLLQN
jgi:hypothetical protein